MKDPFKRTCRETKLSQLSWTFPLLGEPRGRLILGAGTLKDNQAVSEGFSDWYVFIQLDPTTKKQSIRVVSNCPC